MCNAYSCKQKKSHEAYNDDLRILYIEALDYVCENRVDVSDYAAKLLNLMNKLNVTKNSDYRFIHSIESQTDHIPNAYVLNIASDQFREQIIQEKEELNIVFGENLTTACNNLRKKIEKL